MKTSDARALTARVHALAQERATEFAAASMKVPISYYRDRALWDWERTELLRSTPVLAAPSAQVPNPGDFHVRDLLDASVLITRGHDGQAHALLNYCSHRAACIADGSGNRQRFICPYHHWTYGCDGALRGRPRPEGFDDLPAEELGLVALPSEERHGLIWCTLDPDAGIELDRHLGALGAELAQSDYGACTYLDHRELEVRANWKAGLENFADFYHVPYVHKLVEGSHVDDAAAFDRIGRHHRLVSGLSSLYELSERDAHEVPDEAHLVVAYWVYPNLVVINSSLTIDLIQIQPGADPGSSMLRHTSLARRSSLAEEELKEYMRLWKTLDAVFTVEDVAALERSGDGLTHSAREYLLIGKNEPGIQNMVRRLQAEGQHRTL